MNKDDFTKKVTSKLDTLATHHKAKPVVINHVLETIQDRPSPHYSMWRMTGFALAAAITGFVILPNSMEMTEQPQNQVAVTPKLSPQMVEDLEMLLVLGEDRVGHGS